MTKKLSDTSALGAKTLFEALQIIKENGGELPYKNVLEEVPKRVELDEWARARYEKTGNIRWQSVFSFFSIDAVKAGFLLKKKRIWYLTPEGEEALKLGPTGLLQEAQKRYRKWKAEQDQNEGTGEGVGEGDDEKGPAMTLEQIEQIAVEGLEEYIGSKNAYELQDLAAALLRGMGYHTPFVAPKGKDGGVDIIAYRDPLGTESPRIKVQVKHRDQSATVQEVRQLMGLLQKDGDVGIFISTGGYTPDAKTAARGSHIHIELIDLPRFISLWQEFYHKLTDEDKAHMPLLPVYFLEPSD